MNKKDQAILDAINGELKRQGIGVQITPHPLFPMRKVLMYEPNEQCLVRVHTELREVDIFTYDSPGSVMGSSEKIGGPFRGRGWLQRLAQAAALAVSRVHHETRKELP